MQIYTFTVDDEDDEDVVVVDVRPPERWKSCRHVILSLPLSLSRSLLLLLLCGQVKETATVI